MRLHGKCSFLLSFALEPSWTMNMELRPLGTFPDPHPLRGGEQHPGRRRALPSDRPLPAHSWRVPCVCAGHE